MQYLADRKPNALWPNDARARADIMRWQSWQLQHWGKEACDPLLFERIVKRFFNWGPPDPAVEEKATAAFHREAQVLNAHLSKQRYLAGGDVTLADFSVAAPLFHAQEADFPLTPYAHIREWFGRVSALPAWQATAPQMPAAAA
jgi:glutathione S-transferase